MIKKLNWFLIIAFLFTLFTPFVADAETSDIPAPVGDIYVQDFANKLTPQEEKVILEAGRKLEDKTKAQISVMIVGSINNQGIEEYSTEAFRKYKLGDEKLNNGVLLLIALNEKKIRIEVGYGLEGVLPDGKVGRIIDENAMPYLKQNQIGKAAVETYKILFNEVSKEYKLDDTLPVEHAKQTSEGKEISVSTIIIIIVIIIVVLILDIKFFDGFLIYLLPQILSFFLNNGGGGNRGGGGGSSGGGGASRDW